MVKESKSLLKVTANVPAAKADKNGKNYNRVSVMPLPKTSLDETTGEVYQQLDMKARGGSFNQYADSYLTPGQPDIAFNAPIGTRIEGAVVSRPCEEYTFENKEGETIVAESYTTIVFGDTTQPELFEKAVHAAFKAADHELEEMQIEVEPDKATQPVED